MTDPLLRLEMRDTEFVITMPGTSYQVTFRQLADGPGLIPMIMTDGPNHACRWT
jgi:hypothetical protein